MLPATPPPPPPAKPRITPWNVFRYDEGSAVTINLDPFTDVVTWLEYYAASDYVASLLTTRHGVPLSEAKRRARLIAPHIRLARQYVDQAESGPGDVSFLPGYYAILNLLKVCILFGPHHAQLPNHRWHGASYDVDAKDSQNLLTDRIRLRRGGAIPLSYQTITGQPIRHDALLAMGDVYPFILDASLEYELATGKQPRIARLQFGIFEEKNERKLTVFAKDVAGNSIAPRVNQLKPLIGFIKDPSTSNRFTSGPIAGLEPHHIKAHLRPFLIYGFLNGDIGAPISGSHLLLPEELPIALAFFHMSSVVRYKPEFLAKLKDSRFWPLLSAVRRHGMFKFLVVFWSFTQRKALVLG